MRTPMAAGIDNNNHLILIGLSTHNQRTNDYCLRHFCWSAFFFCCFTSHILKCARLQGNVTWFDWYLLLFPIKFRTNVHSFRFFFYSFVLCKELNGIVFFFCLFDFNGWRGIRLCSKVKISENQMIMWCCICMHTYYETRKMRFNPVRHVTRLTCNASQK